MGRGGWGGGGGWGSGRSLHGSLASYKPNVSGRSSCTSLSSIKTARGDVMTRGARVCHIQQKPTVLRVGLLTDLISKTTQILIDLDTNTHTHTKIAFVFECVCEREREREKREREEREQRE